MSDTIEFELVAPERLLVSESVEMAVVPGSEGDFGVLAGHAPTVAAVRPGVIAVYENGAVTARFFVSGGFAEVTPERCTVLADDAIDVSAIDRTAVEAEIKDLSDDLSDAASEEEKGKIQTAIVIAQSKLAAAQSSN